MSSVKAVFLCGGVGQRMFPLGGGKYLLKFLGRTLLEHQIEMALSVGVEHFVIVGGPARMKDIEKVVAKFPGASFEMAIQEEPEGMARALECAAPFLGDEFLVVNPNDVLDPSAYRLLLEAGKGSADGYVLGRRVKEHFPGGYLVVGPGGELRDIVEKPKPGKEPSNLVNIVLHFHREGRYFLELISRVGGPQDDAYERALKALVEAGHRVEVLPYEGFWAAIKYPWHIFAVMDYFLSIMPPGVAASAQVSNRAVVEGSVWLGEGVRVLENAVLRGPCYVGRGTVIGNNVLVRGGCHIGEGCVVGFGTEVKHSYIGDGCQFHMNYVGDSIIGDGCSLGAGAVTANWRLDETTVKVEVDGVAVDTGMDKLGVLMGPGAKSGIGASFMPGVRVGPGAWVGPGVCLTEDLSPSKMALAMPQYRTLTRKGKGKPCVE